MSSTVFDSFTKLTREKVQERLNGAGTLLKYMSQKNTEEDKVKELKYALKRLVRGLGSSREFARKGFYSAFTVYLSMNSDIEVSKIMEIVESELSTVNSNTKSENADINMGRILACGALIRSKVLIKLTSDEQLKVLECLIKAGNQRSYLSFVSVSFILDFAIQLDEVAFKTILWPLLQTELGKSWSDQTLDTFYALLVVKEKFPSVVKNKFLRQYLGNEHIISSDSMKDVVTLLSDIPRFNCYQHPVYEIFCKKLCETQYVVEFWTGIDQRFIKPSKSIERLAIKILTLLLSNIKDKSILPSLLSTHFLQHMLKRFSGCKRSKTDEIAIAFKEVFTVLINILNDKEIKSKTSIGVLKKLLFYPGDLMIEKITSTKIIQMITANLNTEGVKKLSKLYRDIAVNAKPKENSAGMEHWTNAERAYAAQMLTRLLGHSVMSSDHDWRLEQLQFLFSIGLCESPNIGTELAPQFKDTFYRALDHKLPKLSDLRDILSALVRYIDEELFLKNALTLRAPLTDSVKNVWKDTMILIKKLEKDSKNEAAAAIFHTLDLHMALQLFTESEMAVSCIKELDSCYERLSKKRSKKTKKTEIEDNNEPEWVEVVVDLLLSLLSRNNHLLRSLVGCVFPHMCTFLTASSIHQILDVLDVKNVKGPLTSNKGDNDDDEDDNDDSDDDNDEYEEDSSVEESGPNENGRVEDDHDDSDEDHDDKDSDSDDDDDSEAENGKEDLNDSDLDMNENDAVTDRLRMAVRQALGDALVQSDEEDIDVDQIDDAEGKRLDESLAAAFRILRENRKNKSKKQEKSAETLTHFRIRAIDLLEVYLDSSPVMALALDMLVPLFALLEFCIKNPHEKPLENRVRACLKKLSSVKKFKNTDDVDELLFTDILKVLIEKGERSASVCQEMSDKLAECCTFLVRCIQQANISSDKIAEIYTENLIAFFRKRDCVLPAILFKSILQLRWDGNWKLAPILVDFSFDPEIRSFRRSQALEFLGIFFRNYRLIRSNEKHTEIRLKLEKKLYDSSITFLENLSISGVRENEHSTPDKSVKSIKDGSQKFASLLFALIHTIQPHHLPKVWNWKAFADALTKYRANVSLSTDAKSAYNKLAAQIGLPTNITKKKDKKECPAPTNGNLSDGEEAVGIVRQESLPKHNINSKDSEDTAKDLRKEEKKRRKIKSKQKNKQKLKKEARELRATVMADGFEPLNFSSAVLTNGNIVDSSDSMDGEHDVNGATGRNDRNPRNSHVKRSLPEDLEGATSKAKKKKKKDPGNKQ
ncbi:DNA polymerase V [Cephus cinctus]|uniref:DNA polymerase V n=1 Tax=Cephus cinctus TaxID=211228 RepID=A0AAJ7CCI8_CEPCN|nr:DNA polymerase V [Cephus cinctus]